MIGFNATEILRFYDLANLAWNCIFTTIWGVGAYFSMGHISPFILTQKGTTLRVNASFDAQRVCQCRSLTCGEDWEKIRKVKSHQSIWAEHPTQPICAKICTWRDVLDLITCAKFQTKNLRGCDSTVGRNFHFPIDFNGHCNRAVLLCCLWWRIATLFKMNLKNSV